MLGIYIQFQFCLNVNSFLLITLWFLSFNSPFFNLRYFLFVLLIVCVYFIPIFYLTIYICFRKINGMQREKKVTWNRVISDKICTYQKRAEWMKIHFSYERDDICIYFVRPKQFFIFFFLLTLTWIFV